MWRYLLLGLIQGLTEFLPVSSSAHLVFAQSLLGLDPPGVMLEAALHLGTLLAVLVYFRREIARLVRGALAGERGSLKYIGLLAVGTVPVAVVGLLLRERVEAAFEAVRLSGGLLLVTGVLLLLAERGLKAGPRGKLGVSRALLVGLAQAAALFPGISRSGATISAGILSGLDAGEAARFSFLLAIPAILGAGILSFISSPPAPGEEIRGAILGGAVAFVCGLLAIKFLLSLLFRGRLSPFAFYCFALGTLALILG